MAAFQTHFRFHDFVVTVVNSYRQITYPKYDLLFSIIFPSLHVSPTAKDVLTLFLLASAAAYFESKERDKRDPITSAFLSVSRSFGENYVPFFERRDDRNGPTLYSPLRRFLEISLDPVTIVGFAIAVALIAWGIWRFGWLLAKVPWWVYLVWLGCILFSLTIDRNPILIAIEERRWENRLWGIVNIIVTMVILILALPAVPFVLFLFFVLMLGILVTFSLYVVVYVLASPWVAWRTSSAAAILFVLALVLDMLAARGAI
jgi:hypothetical protein